MGYDKSVKRTLEGKANVIFPTDNCRFAAYLLRKFHEYLSDIKGEDIDLYARCVSVADVFDALVSKRPYKKAWLPEDARKEIISQSGRQFDPAIVKAFDENYDKFIAVLEKYPDSYE